MMTKSKPKIGNACVVILTWIVYWNQYFKVFFQLLQNLTILLFR